MRIIANFTANQVSEHLYQIAWDVDHGRTFGSGWCLIDNDICPVPEHIRQYGPCRGNTALCQHLPPVNREHPLPPN
jgi:hypothetical protein